MYSVKTSHGHQSFTKENLENIPAFDDRHFQESLLDIIHKEDVLQKLKSLEINKSPGSDGHQGWGHKGGPQNWYLN